MEKFYFKVTGDRAPCVISSIGKSVEDAMRIALQAHMKNLHMTIYPNIEKAIIGEYDVAEYHYYESSGYLLGHNKHCTHSTVIVSLFESRHDMEVILGDKEMPPILDWEPHHIPQKHSIDLSSMPSDLGISYHVDKGFCIFGLTPETHLQLTMQL